MSRRTLGKPGHGAAALGEGEPPPFRARTSRVIFQDLTVVIVSHDERLREIADRVLWLEDGELKALEALVRDPVREPAAV